MLKSNKKIMKQFMRIAMARLRCIYRFTPQRRAVAARMFIKWINRKNDV